MSWDTAGQTAENAKSRSGLFARLENNGDKMIVAFLGEPEAKEVHWTGDSTEMCTGENCKKCKKGNDPQARFSINVFVKTKTVDGDIVEVEKVQIFEQGVRWYRDLEAVKAKYGLEKWWFEIEREGKAGSKKTKYSILPEEKITDDDKKKLAKAELNDLTKTNDNNDDDDDDDDDKDNKKSKSSSSSKKQSDGPMNADDVSDIMRRMQNQPKDEIKKFLEKFDVKRFKDLKTSQRADAIKFVKQLESTNEKENKSEDEETDPFS